MKKNIATIAFFLVFAMMCLSIFILNTFVSSTKETLSNNLINGIREGDTYFTFNAHGMDLVEILFPISKDPTLFNSDYINTTGTQIGDFFLIHIPKKYDSAEDKQHEIDLATNQILTELSISDKSDFDKVFAIYDWICRNIEYERLDDYYDQDIYYALVHRKSVCAGLSKTFVYLLNQVGIDGYIISGQTLGDNPQNHAWAVAYIDNVPYSFDITNDIGKHNNSSDGMNMYEYFAITSKEIAEKYSVSEYVSMISCTSSDCDLFAKNGMVVENCDIDLLISLAEQYNGRFLVKCIDDFEYEQASKLLHRPEFKDRLHGIFGKDSNISVYANSCVNTIGLSIS